MPTNGMGLPRRKRGGWTQQSPGRKRNPNRNGKYGMGGPTCKAAVHPKFVLFFDENISPSPVQVTTRLVAFPHADMSVRIASSTAIDVARLAPPVSISLSPFPMNTEDHFET